MGYGTVVYVFDEDKVKKVLEELNEKTDVKTVIEMIERTGGKQYKLYETSILGKNTGYYGLLAQLKQTNTDNPENPGLRLLIGLLGGSPPDAVFGIPSKPDEPMGIHGLVSRDDLQENGEKALSILNSLQITHSNITEIASYALDRKIEKTDKDIPDLMRNVEAGKEQFVEIIRYAMENNQGILLRDA